MTDKPLEWTEDEHQYDSHACADAFDYTTRRCYFITRKLTAEWCELTPKAIMSGLRTPVTGPYDGTIETAKQRCEEHRRKVKEVNP